MPQRLRQHDKSLIELDTEDGSVFLAPGFQGRIFCQLQGQLIQRLDDGLLEGPPPSGFNNVGGNYVLPAPEGGDFAFNYLPNDSAWLVQDSFNTANPKVVDRTAANATVEKEVELTNRKGITINLKYHRTVRTLSLNSGMRELGLDGVRYESVDTFVPMERYRAEEVLVAPWSLEQFPGGDGVVSFSAINDPRHSINFDFYSDPSDRVDYRDDFFLFPLGDSTRHQIGLKARHHPRYVAALDSKRSMLYVRKTALQSGTYFNIADNAQPAGPYSAADLYSVFDGGEMGFFELETIGAMNTHDGYVDASTLTSETLVLHGPIERLQEYIARWEHTCLNQ